MITFETMWETSSLIWSICGQKKLVSALTGYEYYSLDDCGTHGCLAGHGPHAGILPTKECFYADGSLDWNTYINHFFELADLSDFDEEEETYNSVFDRLHIM